MRPEIVHPTERDSDMNGIDDQLDGRLRAARSAIAAERDPARLQTLRAGLREPVRVELVFSRRITQEQIDNFIALGGQIEYIYQSVSYGWNATLPLEAAEMLRGLLGDSFVAVIADRPAQLHMDEATQTGRIRPVWASGFAGNPSGFSGGSTTTIGILDTGIDDSHTDLSGRQEYWKDWTSDNEASPRDIIQHGSHVTGIACGIGAAAGSAAGTLYYTDSGDMSALTAGYFYPTPIHIPTGSSITFSSTATWLGGGSTNLYGLYNTNGSTGGYTAISASTVGASPITESNTFTPSSSRLYSAGLVQGSPATVGQFAIENSVTNYPGMSDGFNKLSGVAPGCKWAGGKVFKNDGTGSSLDIQEAVDDMVAQRVAHNIKVVNMSLGIIGNPGKDTVLRSKVNTMVNNGIIAVVSAGNDGPGTAKANLIDDPGRAALAITVAASNDVNQLTTYTSSGFSSPASDEDNKPDVMAPGGSDYYSLILSVDSNDADAEISSFADRRANDYYNIKGTSMSSPFAAGSAALVIQALESAGLTWSFSSSAHPLLVKMLLCATSTESNAPREVSSGTNPTLGRAASPKDLYEGYGMLNPDAAVEAASLSYTGGNLGDGTAGGYFDRRAWARKVVLAAGGRVVVSLAVPGAGDYDLYLYSGSPDSKGNPVIRTSSTNTASGAAESIDYTSVSGETVYMVIKRVSGNGSWTLTGTTGSDTTPPTVSSIVRKTPTAQYYNGSSVVWTVTFNETINATTVSTGDFTLVDVSGTITGESITSVTPTTGTATAFDVTAGTGTSGNGTLRLDVMGATAAINDVAGNDITADYTSGETYIIDKTAPTVVLSDNHADAIVRDADTVIVTATFTEANGINETPAPTITIANGGVTAAAMTKSSNLVWTYSWNVPTGNAAATVSISATDLAGNANSAATGKTAYTIDNTPPSVDAVTDEGSYTPSTTELKATISATDAESGIVAYQYAIGTTAGDNDIADWAASTADVTKTGLTLSAGSTYYFSVKAQNGAGLWSAPADSDGIKVVADTGSIADAKALDNAEEVALLGKALTANFGDCIYIQEQPLGNFGAIKVAKDGVSYTVGSYVDVAGLMNVLANGERVILSPTVKSGTGTKFPNPLLIVGRDLGGQPLNVYTPGIPAMVGVNNLGMLVNVYGKLTKAESGYWLVGDGGVFQYDPDVQGVSVDVSKLSAAKKAELLDNDFVVMTGICIPDTVNLLLVPIVKLRGDADVTYYR